ncbi:AAA family ATPase [Kaistia geumhonensis]|uniref:NadR/Ttd14 AAA domain-containing protein n=1 Tax=Kaistia geumhonensis TaxID=410839 RepID=A0ABU0MA77_9HYPH|nr:AAA family ATPase [Kaistia geumhonensis]MCX5480620.1 AAA family ATPase [Kaistia geumhonensis]MDQ0517678.1 hypothetical protein [Kaistia geumhonensis]
MMRIAVSGTHDTGKSTLIEDFVAAFPDFEAVSEPYWTLVERGVAFAARPVIADFEAQLGESCRLILDEAHGENVVFDRCPLDFLAYLDVIGAGEGFEWLPQGKLLARISRALASLDRIVFIPLVQPDEIASPIELATLRRRVDARMKSMIRDDDLGLLSGRTRVIEVTGTRPGRLETLTSALGLASQP